MRAYCSPPSGPQNWFHAVGERDLAFGLSPRQNYRQQDVRRTTRIVVHGVVGDDHAAMLLQRFAGVWVRVESREVRAGDIDAECDAFGKDVGGR